VVLACLLGFTLFSPAYGLVRRVVMSIGIILFADDNFIITAADYAA
jgi:hypothetical protein